MSYVVLARKWRPQSFDDLVGQGHVSRTLANAIASNRVAHAFLFTGVRGVGKTTSARILAKALNCEQGPTASPCQVCRACTEISAGTDVDVQEIDGASYNGVDEVRRLQEGLPYRPQRDRFKIYIVDEVHMLSTAAWNAFLKTLEEPPPHVKFIFATTEVHKVPVTILSRCQRYDFKLIRVRAIKDRLREVLAAERIEADEDALGIIGREAAGSMRDAMSLLDQVIAWIGASGERLTGEGVGAVLGVAARSVLHQLGAALLEGNASACLDIVASLAQQGFSMSNVARDLLAHLRDLVVAKVSPEPSSLLDLADAEVADVVALVAEHDLDDLARLHLGFSRAFDDIARSAVPRAALEMALVRLARRPALVPVDELLKRIALLERRLSGESAGGSAPGGGGPRGAPGRGAPSPRPAQGASVPGRDLPEAQAGVPAGTRAEAPGTTPPGGEAHPASSATPPGAPGPPIEASSGRGSGESTRPSSPPPSARSDPPRSAPTASPLVSPSPPPPAASARVPAPTPASRAEGAPAGDGGVDAAARRKWKEIVNRLAEASPRAASVYGHAAPLSVAAGKIVIGYEPGSFLLNQARAPEALAVLAAVATARLGAATEIEIDTSGAHHGVSSVAAQASEEQKRREAELRQQMAEHPLVVAALQMFDARLRDVRLHDAREPG